MTTHSMRSNAFPTGLMAVAVLYGAAVLLVVLGDSDPPVDPNDAYWYRAIRSIPGILDICGDFTWAARGVPPLLGLLGAGIAFLVRPRSTVSAAAAVVGIALAVGLAYATMQNAVPWGVQRCIE